MIYLQPRRVTLAGQTLDHVSAVIIDRTADLLAVEHSDLGPHVAFVDVPQQRITVRIQRTPVADEPSTLAPGDSATLTLRTAPSPAAPDSRQLSATVVITGVEHDITARKGLIQTITAIAVSTTGAQDPITQTIVPTGGA